MLQYYSGKGCPTEFPVRSKCIPLFQKVHGVDTLLFSMYVYEYGHECPAPNKRRVYISYLDSVQYFEPKCYRTTAYQAILIEYLRYVKNRGFHTAHIWSCPPTPGDDYIFYSHPEHQKVPREDMLRTWYHKMLDKAKAQGIVIRTATLYDEYFERDSVDPVPGQRFDARCLPYFEGDYIPGEIENIIRHLKTGQAAPKITSSSDGVARDEVMTRLGHSLAKMKDNFIVVHLRNRRFAAAVERGEDVSNWREDSDEEIVRSKRAKISGKDPGVGNRKSDEAAGHLSESAASVTSEKAESTAPESTPSAFEQPVKPSSYQTESNLNDSVKKEGEAQPPEGQKVADDGAAVSAKSPAATFDSVNDETMEVVNGRGRDATEGTSVIPDAVEQERIRVSLENADVKPSELVPTEDASPKIEGAAVIEKEMSPQCEDQPAAQADSTDTKTDTDLAGSTIAAERSVQKRTGEPSKQEEVSGSGAPTESSLTQAEGADISEAVVMHPSSENEPELMNVDSNVGAAVQATKEPNESAVLVKDSPSEPMDVPSVERSSDPTAKEGVDMPPKVPVEAPINLGMEEIRPAISKHFADLKRPLTTVSATTDEDEPFESEMFESRQCFLNYCQTTHCQFDQLRRAKHATMMVLFQLHNPMAPKFVQQCGACYVDITHGIRYHCNNCPDFDLCQDCYEPVTTGQWAKRDSRFAHDKSHSFTPVDMEASAENKGTREERQKALKAHIALLEHAGTCDGRCSLQNCERMKGLFRHVRECEIKPKKDCRICNRLLSLCAVHARLCSVRGECPIPFCDRIRERHMRLRRQQQQMDDRRRQAQNELYHAGDV